jgi:hypothetical protein
MGTTTPRQPAERMPLGHPALTSVVNQSVDDAPGFDQEAPPAYAASAESVESRNVELPRTAGVIPRESLSERAGREATNQRHQDAQG